MISIAYPFKIQYIRPVDGVVTHVATIQKHDFTFVVNGVRVAYARRLGRGSTVPSSIDALIEPVIRRGCEAAKQQDVATTRILGTAVPGFRVILCKDGEPVFEQTFPMHKLGPVVSSFYPSVRYSGSPELAHKTGGQNPAARQSDGQPEYYWRLAADLSMPLGVQERPSRAGSVVVLESADEQVEPVWTKRPVADLVGPDPDGGLPVFVSRAALNQMLTHAAEAPRDVEIGGALIGRIGRDDDGIFVIVEHAPMLSTTGTAATVTFCWDAFEQARREAMPDGCSLAGLWHVHPDALKQVSASVQDLWAFQTFFTEVWHLFVVLGTSLDKTSAYAWSRDGEVERVGLRLFDTNREE